MSIDEINSPLSPGPHLMQKPFESRAGSSVSSSTRMIASSLRRRSWYSLPPDPTAPAPKGPVLQRQLAATGGMSGLLVEQAEIALGRREELRPSAWPRGQARAYLRYRADTEALAELLPDVRAHAVAVCTRQRVI